MPKKKEKLKQLIYSTIFGPRGLPLVLSLTVLALLFVLFRMKNVEQEYQLASQSEKVSKVKSRLAELKAKRARLLSVTNLRHLAKKFGLKEPSPNQIIVIK